jgi:hypothetical protein
MILWLYIVGSFFFMAWTFIKTRSFSLLVVISWIVGSILALGVAYGFEAVKRYLNETD